MCAARGGFYSHRGGEDEERPPTASRCPNGRIGASFAVGDDGLSVIDGISLISASPPASLLSLFECCGRGWVQTRPLSALLPASLSPWKMPED